MPQPTALFLTILLIGCSGPSKKNSDENATIPTEETKNINDLTYEQVVAMVLADTSDLGEWHNAPIETVANADLSITLEGTCGENDCGQEVFLTNSGQKTVSATISTVYAIEESPWLLSQVISINGGDKISLGCSHLCYGDNSVSFDRKIEGSSYVD